MLQKTPAKLAVVDCEGYFLDLMAIGNMFVT